MVKLLYPCVCGYYPIQFQCKFRISSLIFTWQKELYLLSILICKWVIRLNYFLFLQFDCTIFWYVNLSAWCVGFVVFIQLKINLLYKHLNKDIRLDFEAENRAARQLLTSVLHILYRWHLATPCLSDFW